MAVLALAQSTAYFAVGVITAAFLLAGAIYAKRVEREVAKIDTTARRTETLQTGQASLIEDLQVERDALRDEITVLRDEVREARMEGHENRREIGALKANARETEAALLACRESEKQLRAEIAEMKR